MKILELTNYSAGGCGVWARVKKESELLSKKGHEVLVISSNHIKGSKKKALAKEKLGEVNVKRVPAIKLGGEAYLFWDFKKEALKFNPDIIIAHSYRIPHTTKALRLKGKTGSKVFLVTHAPFDRSNTRKVLARISVWVYDSIIGPATLKNFDKIISITKWENSFLEKLGVPKRKVEYIPNGIKEEFFRLSRKKETKKIVYTGRVTRIKKIETAILALKKVKDKKASLEILGPAEEDYLAELKKLVARNELENRVTFENHFYNVKEQIEKLDSARVFVLPSESEGMSQVLVEAMARAKIVIASDNRGAKDLIKDGKNGFLFPIRDSRVLAQKIDLALSSDQTQMQKNAKKSVEKFSWDKVITKLEKLIR